MIDAGAKALLPLPVMFLHGPHGEDKPSPLLCFARTTTSSIVREPCRADRYIPVVNTFEIRRRDVVDTNYTRPWWTASSYSRGEGGGDAAGRTLVVARPVSFTCLPI